MAETGIENRIMGDLNAYSPVVSGQFPALPFSPKQCRYHTCVDQAALGIVFSLVTSPASRRPEARPDPTWPDQPKARLDPSMARPDPTVDGCRQRRWVCWWLMAMVDGNGNECVDGWRQRRWVCWWLTAMVDGDGDECVNGWRQRQWVRWWLPETAMSVLMVDRDGWWQRRWVLWW